MRPTRAPDLVLPGLVAAVVIYLLVRVDYGSLPPLPRLGGVTLLVLALIEAVLGHSLRARIRGRRGTKPVQPLAAARAVALAKASSLAGAIMCGAWLGVLGYVFPASGSGNSAAGGDTVSAAVGAGCAGALVAAALWLEYSCRTPDDPGRSQRRDDSRRPGDREER